MDQPPITSMSVLFGRLFWMFIGPALLAGLALQNLQNGHGWLTLADFAYFVVLGGIPLARWLEYQGGNAVTSIGEPANWAQFYRYSATVVVAGVLVWLVVNVLGNPGGLAWLEHI